MVRALGRLLKNVKDAWEWWLLLVGLGVLPTVPVILAFFQQWSWDVVALYLVVIAAFWIVLWVEVAPLFQVVATLVRRMRQQLEVETEPTCCTSAEEAPTARMETDDSGRVRIVMETVATGKFLVRVGISNPSRRTIENVRVYLSLAGAELDGHPIGPIKDRVLRWVTPDAPETYRIDPTPPDFHHHVDLMTCEGGRWSLSIGGGQQIDPKPYEMKLRVLGGDLSPSEALLDVRPGDTGSIQVALVNPGIFGGLRARIRTPEATSSTSIAL
jgi:hypothetical protein